ncbi:MAG: tetratricopeptide repeat protein [Vicinamibacterales bacterium]
MDRHTRFARTAFSTALVVGLLLQPAVAQQGGMIKGKVVDAQNQPVDGAKVTVEFTGGVNRKYETKTNKRGEFIQIGLQAGPYKVTASKDGVGSQSFDAQVRSGSPAEINFQLQPNGGGDAGTAEGFKKAFDEGVTANTAGDFDGAVAKFTEASTINPACYQCQFNIGAAYMQKKDYANAETFFKKAIEMKADYGQAYSALANLYNVQKKFDEAAKMSAEAAKLGGAAGGDADAVYNQGVILWNAGKIAEAKTQFEETIKLKPDYADAHYWMGMANLNEGKMPDAAGHFEEYLKLAPTGQYAAQAKGVLSQIKK